MCSLDSSPMPILLVGSLMLFALSPGQADEVLGTAMCKRAEPGGPCTAAWDFTAVRHASTSYWVEKFVYDSSAAEWRSVAGPFSGRKGESDQTVDPGFLYRVIACKGRSNTTDCVGSTAFWAPVRPENLDDIPDFVETPRGRYKRSKHLDALDQVVEYNAALVSKLIYSVDMSLMPPMTEPAVSDTRVLLGGDQLVLEDAVIEYNVHVAYGDPDLRDDPALGGQASQSFPYSVER